MYCCDYRPSLTNQHVHRSPDVRHARLQEKKTDAVADMFLEAACIWLASTWSRRCVFEISTKLDDTRDDMLCKVGVRLKTEGSDAKMCLDLTCIGRAPR